MNYFKHIIDLVLNQNLALPQIAEYSLNDMAKMCNCTIIVIY